jgi:hypothetical protein
MKEGMMAEMMKKNNTEMMKERKHAKMMGMMKRINKNDEK